MPRSASRPVTSMPAMKATEIVGAHDPHKVHAGAAPDQISDGGKRIGNAVIGFEAGNVDASVAGEVARGGESLGERRQAAGVLKRIAGGDEPPDPIKPDPPHRQ